jgi:hypothetical protein
MPHSQEPSRILIGSPSAPPLELIGHEHRTDHGDPGADCQIEALL